MKWLKDILGRFSKRPTSDEYADLQRRIGYHFNDITLLQEALTHRSYVNIPGQGHLPSYERLEFLGDSVLGICVAEYVFHHYEQYAEGDLTKLKASVVNIHSLTELSRSLELGKYIRLSPEERRAGGDDRPSILSDVFESLTGAIFLDGDLGQARGWISRVLLNNFERWRRRIEYVNFKGNLLEYLQARALGMPRYEVLSETGPDHDKMFTVQVYCLNRSMGIGKGSSKKEAEQAAAEIALRRIQEELPLAPD